MADGQIPHIAHIFKDASAEDIRLAALKRLRAKHALLDLQAAEAANNLQNRQS